MSPVSSRASRQAGVTILLLLVGTAAVALAAQTQTASDIGTLVDVTGLFVLGLLLVMVELFLFPGHGIAALPGLGLILWSFYRCVDRLGLETGTTVAALELGVAGLVTYAVMRVFPLTPAAEALFHKGHITHRVAPETETLHEMTWVGKRGTAVSDLRPAGSARFEDRLLDVVSEDGYVDKGTAVEVARFEDGRVIVRKLGGD
ncbi:MAG: NfeD family protein [Candidatus Wallbacteria bacterium]|nr:NfeD family protein [Candidatus Wallbacteria bacterium]